MSNNEKKDNIKYLRSKAVKQAWEREVKLVKQGKGTRQWTQAEQRELLLTGRIKKYVGHHVKSVKSYPQYAGTQENIQFLTRSEHYNAHLYDWKNSFNNYFNAEKKSWGRFSENVGLQVFQLKSGLSEIEKTNIQKFINSQKGNVKMGWKVEDYEKQFNELNLKAKNRINQVYEACKGGSMEETATNMARVLRRTPEEKNNIFMPIVYEKEMGRSDFLNAYTSTLATNKFFEEHSNEITASHGRTVMPVELQEFKKQQGEKCKENVKKLNEKLLSLGENAVNFNRECYSKGKDLYSAQQQKWESGTQSANTKEQTLNKVQNSEQNVNQTNNQQSNQKNSQTNVQNRK